MSERLSAAAQELLDIESQVLEFLSPSSIRDFDQENPLYPLVTRYDFNARHAYNILKTILPEDKIPQGIGTLKDIHFRCHFEPPHLESPGHKKKHHH